MNADAPVETKEAKLARALRDNLRRRKPPPQVDQGDSPPRRSTVR